MVAFSAAMVSVLKPLLPPTNGSDEARMACMVALGAGCAMA
jgi:hypothetical protein